MIEESATISMPKVTVGDLEKRVVGSKAASTSRYYLAMLKRLEEYNRSELLDLARVDSDYVEGFGSFLIDTGSAPTTANIFQRAFRAVMKDAFGAEFRKEFKSAFREVDSANMTTARGVSYGDLMRIADRKGAWPDSIERARLIFLYAIVSGGLSLAQLKELAAQGSLPARIAQQRALLSRFESEWGWPMARSIERLSEGNYIVLLGELGRSARIGVTLTPVLAPPAWAALARKAGVRHEVIEAMTGADGAEISEMARNRALRLAANALIDMKHRWFVMKCSKIAPQEVEDFVVEQEIIEDSDDFTPFIPPRPRMPRGKEREGRSPLEKMLFFNTTAQLAARIRKAVRERAWVYTEAGTSHPSQISDAEMRTFMLLCDVSAGTLECHFPDSAPRHEEITLGRRAEIVNGSLTGYVGIISSLPDNKYKVTMTLTALSAHVTAEVPLDFLRLLPE